MPKRLIVILGSNDQVFSVKEEVDLLKKAGWSNPEPGKNITINGITCAFYVLDCVDHIWEPYSSETSRIIQNWLNVICGNINNTQPQVELLAYISILVLPALGCIIVPVATVEILTKMGIDLPDWRKCYYHRMGGHKETLSIAIGVGLGFYIIVGVPLGFTFAPFMPQTFYRFLLMVIFLVILYPGALLWEFIFRRLIPLLLKRYELGDYAVFVSPLVSVILKYVLLVASLALFGRWLASIGYSYLSIIYGIQGFMTIVGILIVILTEIPSAITYSTTGRIEYSALSSTIFLAIFVASAAPVLVFINPPTPISI